ncbi:hypothetical protein PHMEG_00010275 [Phytophthora megakarya]|uniref:YCII-related domain-containing protein n=1 Tax=Phytophthora megakarya TaxID=4795 RepID=A0A225WE32_9STRA|nr:hypothetical protein PHMEG_00010275 [Phytophthora megakarya]
MSSSSPDNKFFVLQYNYVEDYLERRVPIRPQHLEHALNAKESGHLVMGGPFVNPSDAAIVIFKTPDRTVVENFAKNDPYVRENVVSSFSIREWMVTV